MLNPNAAWGVPLSKIPRLEQSEFFRRRSTTKCSLGTDGAGGGPVGVANALEVHFKKANRILARHDTVANLTPCAVLDNC